MQLRARRLGLQSPAVQLAAATNVRDIIASLDTAEPPDLVVIDSIQTMYLDNLDSAPGTVAQVRSSAAELIRLAKRRGFVLMLVGHVTKEGQIAGPRVLEHMVDTVLYFEGERGHQFRILRAVKNRFGPTDEIGVFEMTDGGLQEVANPSALFLAERRGNVSGAAVFAGIEGTRPVLVEIQALVSPSPLGHAAARRGRLGSAAASPWCWRCWRPAAASLSPATRSISTSPGGLRIAEPAADLAVALALVQRLDRPAGAGGRGGVRRDRPVRRGAPGLAGRVAPAGGRQARLPPRVLMPRRRDAKTDATAIGGVEVLEIGHLQDVIDWLYGEVRSLSAGKRRWRDDWQ